MTVSFESVETGLSHLEHFYNPIFTSLMIMTLYNDHNSNDDDDDDDYEDDDDDDNDGDDDN